MRSSWHFNPMSHTSGLSWASMFRLYIRSDIMTSRAPNHLLSRCGYDHVSLVPDDIPPLLAEGQSGASQTSEVSLVQIILNAPKSHLLQRLRILLAQLDGHLPGCPAITLGLGQLVGVRLGRPGGLGRQPGPLARGSAHAGDALAGPRRPAQRGAGAVSSLPPAAGQRAGGAASGGHQRPVSADQGRHTGLLITVKIRVDNPNFHGKLRV